MDNPVRHDFARKRMRQLERQLDGLDRPVVIVDNGRK